MRNLRLLDLYRRTDRAVIERFGWSGDETCGAFAVPSPIDKQSLLVIASIGGGWEHVSISRSTRCPNWQEMAYIKELFFRDDEAVVEFHVPKAEHVNDHPYCLHLWRPTDFELPRPPRYMVGGMSEDEALRQHDDNMRKRSGT